MRLYENEAKIIFDLESIPIPIQFGTIQSVEELEKISNLNFPLMVKAMVLIGGRGKAGGIKKANDLNEAKTAVSELMKIRIHGYHVNSVMLEENVDIKGEIYLGITTDPISFDVVLIASALGGVDIEEIAKSNPDAIWKKSLPDNPAFLPETVARDTATFLISQFPQLHEAKEQLQSIISSLYATFQKYDAKICEINPLVVSNGNEPVAVDAKIVLDDNALYRQSALLTKLGIDPESKRHDVAEQTKFEARAHKAGIIGYIDLLPEPEKFEKDPEKLYVGLVPGGAGYGIFSIDEVVNIGNKYFNKRVVPINFMDSGGGPTLSTVAEMFHLLMDHPVPDLIITSRFGGISSCDIFIRGLIQALRDRHAAGKRLVPVYGRMVGTDLSNARVYLEKAKKETVESLKDLHIVVGNQKIMAEIIKEGIEYGFKLKKQQKKE
ncbi:MAG: ATP-grasp domain-containing protein [Promethearchaeota archaeon]